jgi:hypothetical protein
LQTTPINSPKCILPDSPLYEIMYVSHT